MTPQKCHEDYGPLGDDAVVVELGGYAGNFSLDVLNNFNPKSVHLFEPVPKFMDMCKSGLSKWNQVTYHQVAVGETDGETTLRLCADATNGFTPGPGESVTVPMISPATFVGLLPDIIDLSNFNCEGGEYPVLEFLLSTGHISRFRNLWIQFHSVTGGAERMTAICRELAKTHVLTRDHGMAWQKWCSRVGSNHRLSG